MGQMLFQSTVITISNQVTASTRCAKDLLTHLHHALIVTHMDSRHCINTNTIKWFITWINATGCQKIIYTFKQPFKRKVMVTDFDTLYTWFVPFYNPPGKVFVANMQKIKNESGGGQILHSSVCFVSKLKQQRILEDVW